MRAAAALFFLVLCAAATPAAADRFGLAYEGTALGFINIGHASLDADVSDTSYLISATMESGGLLSLFERTNIHATASGLIQNGAVRWSHYDLDHYYSRKHRTVVMQAGEDGAANAQITPTYRLWGDPRASAEQIRRSRDPLSTLMAMAVDVGQSHRCSGDYPVFDGRFHYLLELGGGDIEPYKGGGFEGQALHCIMSYIAVAGFEAGDGGRRRIPHGQVWFALAPNATFAPPIRVVTPLVAGGATVRLVSWRRVVIDVAGDMH